MSPRLQSIVIPYTNLFLQGESCNGTPRKVTFNLKCDSSATTPVLVSVDENPTCQYTAVLKAAAVCQIAGGGLSIGSIILIVFFPLVFVYFVAGILWNYRKDKESSKLDLIPNISFWRALPGLVKDGCIFVAGACKSCAGRMRGGKGGSREGNTNEYGSIE